MSFPSVSICIPTYNYRRYLANALDSVLAQDFGDMEIVVVDNCSDDGTDELVETYCRRDSRIVFHRNPRNLGMTANFNRALDLARGKYIKFLCADDILQRDCVGKMVDILEANPEVTLVGCRRAVFQEDKPVVRVLGYADKSFFRSGQEVIRECYFRGNLIGEPTAVLFRKSDICAGFDENYDQAFDVELWFRLLENGKFVFLADILCGVREHDVRGTANNLRAGKVTVDKVRLFEHYARRSYLKGSIVERLRWDARMASSVTREVAAGAGDVAKVARKAFYFPRFSLNVLIPLACVPTMIRRRTGII
jgi:glycosyltransferase involved in cell wall biosynthesis